MKYSYDIMMINSSAALSNNNKLSAANLNQAIVNTKQKPVKAINTYGLKLSGFEDRSRQNVSNCLN